MPTCRGIAFYIAKSELFPPHNYSTSRAPSAAIRRALVPRPVPRRVTPYLTTLAGVLTLTALALVKDAIDAFSDPTYTRDTTPGFWIIFAALLALILGARAVSRAQCTVGVERVPMQTMERFLAAIRERGVWTCILLCAFLDNYWLEWPLASVCFRAPPGQTAQGLFRYGPNYYCRDSTRGKTGRAPYEGQDSRPARALAGL